MLAGGSDPYDPAALERAKTRLLAIPGVCFVGYGHKEAAGTIVPQMVLRAYVRAKRPLAALDPAERIPAEIEGIPTDVIVGVDIGLQSSLPTLSPGVQIRRLVMNEAGGVGTLGMIVERAGRRMLLTNDHVLTGTYLNRFIEIYSPDVSGATDCPCNRPAAMFPADLPAVYEPFPAAGPRRFKMDAQLADIVDGVTCTNHIAGVGPIAGGRDVSTAEPSAINGIHLNKRGAKTGVTDATVVDVKLGSGTDEVWQLILSNPTAGAPFDETYELRPDQDVAAKATAITDDPNLALTGEVLSDGRLRVFGQISSFSGDSGSIWVDDAGLAVGLHFGSIGTGAFVKVGSSFRKEVWGRPMACYLKPVFDALALDFTMIYSVTTPARGVVRAALPEPQLMHELDANLRRSERGRVLAGLAQQLYQHVATLVHHRRRVTVTWHRYKGPAFVNAFLKAVPTADQQLPEAIDGVRFADAVAAMRRALELEGNPELRAALATHGDWVHALVAHARSIPELLAALEAPW